MLKKKNDFFEKEENVQYINWKAVPVLKMFISRFSNIKPRRFSTHSVAVQKKLRKAVVRARELGVIGYIK